VVARQECIGQHEAGVGTQSFIVCSGHLEKTPKQARRFTTGAGLEVMAERMQSRQHRGRLLVDGPRSTNIRGRTCGNGARRSKRKQDLESQVPVANIAHRRAKHQRSENRQGGNGGKQEHPVCGIPVAVECLQHIETVLG